MRIVVAMVLFASVACAQQQNATEVLVAKVGEAAINRWPAGNISEAGYPHAWSYEKGTLLQGIQAAATITDQSDFNQFLQKTVDSVVSPDGSIGDFPNEPHSLDQILMGRSLLYMYRKTNDQRYAKAARRVMDELALQPRNRAGGFWHKQIYPTQMWLDGAYMAEPFYAEYASIFHNPAAYEDIVHQFALLESKTRDPKTGLLYHGWDESKQQKWANKDTGLSSQFWGRAMGWYAMALVDTLPYFPPDDPGRKQLLDILQRLSVAIIQAQDPVTGVWWEVLDRRGDSGNFMEASASCMFVYTLATGVRLGYLPASDLAKARAGWAGIEKQFLRVDSDGSVHLTGIVRGAGLGGTPYRSGTYEYYVNERVVSDEPKGVGAFLLAGSAISKAEHIH